MDNQKQNPSQGTPVSPQGVQVPPQPMQGMQTPPQGTFHSPQSPVPLQGTTVSPQGTASPQGTVPPRNTASPYGTVPPRYGYSPYQGGTTTGFYSPAPYKKREPFSLGKTDLRTAAATLILSFFLVVTGLWGAFRAGFTVTFDLLFLVFSLYFKKKETTPGLFAAVCGALAVTLSFVFAVTSNGSVRFFSMALLIGTSVLWFTALTGKKIPGGDLGVLRYALFPIGKAFGDMPLSIRSIFSSKSRRMKSFSKAMIGFLCALPVLMIVLPLLIRSDFAFEGLMSRLFADLGTLAAQTIFALLLAPFLLGFAFSLKKSEPKESAPSSFKGLDTIVLTAFLALLSLFYLLYLFSQLAYFFSAFSGFLPQGFDFSYAEYARRGFFEMSMIAGINLAMLFAMILLAKKQEEKLPVSLKICGTFIGLFTLVLIGTALSKMVMYIARYGMTGLRITTSAFMVFAAVVFCAMLLRLYLPKVRVLQTAVVCAALILAVLGLGNVNAVVARYNYEAYRSQRLSGIDVEYLEFLGDEGVPYLVELTNDSDPEVRQEALVSLRTLYRHYYQKDLQGNRTKTYPKLMQFTLARHRAYRAFEDLEEKTPDFLYEDPGKNERGE